MSCPPVWRTCRPSQGIDVVEPKYYCFWAQPDTDDEIIAAFSQALNEIKDDEALQEVLGQYYAEVYYMSPTEMQEMEDTTVEQMKVYFDAQ